MRNSNGKKQQELLSLVAAGFSLRSIATIQTKKKNDERM
jgi:hypothetical protein